MARAPDGTHMSERYCDLIDVFLTGPLSGNPLAVVHGADGLDDADMLRLTRWLGFSETTFLLPPTDPAADYRVRIFFPAGELPFAGHPTLGTCHAWIEAGGKPRRDNMIVQQCGAGLVDIRRADGMLWFKAPPLLREGPLSPQETATAARLLAIPADRIIDAVHADNGPGWVLLRLAHVDDVLDADIALKPEGVANIGVFAAYEGAGEADFEVRAFFTGPTGVLTEDPVTGSLNAALAQYLFAAGLGRDRYTACQGRAIGSAGRVHCQQDGDGSAWIGGGTATVARQAVLTPLD